VVPGAWKPSFSLVLFAASLPHHEEFRQVLLAELPNHEAGTRRLDQPFRFELAKRFPHGGPADLELRRQWIAEQALARKEFPLEDRLAQHLIDRVRRGRGAIHLLQFSLQRHFDGPIREESGPPRDPRSSKSRHPAESIACSRPAL
jgi:hypothetical protein